MQPDKPCPQCLAIAIEEAEALFEETGEALNAEKMAFEMKCCHAE